MNLLFCCENYWPSVGGVQEVVRQIAERLVRRGHTVTIATSRHPGREIETTIRGVRVMSFDISGNLAKGLRGPVGEYRKFVIDGGFDTIMIKAAQQWTFDALTPILELIKARKVFIPCGFSGLYQRAYRDYFSSMPRWLRCFDQLIFYASDYRDIRFVREHGLTHFVILPNGADDCEFDSTESPEFRTRYGIASDEILLLTVGTLNGAKGHWEVARAFELAHLSRPATLILNGNLPILTVFGRLRQMIRSVMRRQLPPLGQLVRRINARKAPAKRVLVLDMPRTDVVRAFKASDLFVFASYVEYSPLVLFEAAAAGTPFLSTPVGNAAEIASWTSGGVILDSPVDAEGNVRPDSLNLARHMESLLADPVRLGEMGARGRRAFLVGGFSWDAIVSRYENVLVGNT